MNLNAENIRRDIVVIGGSAGALSTVLAIVAGMPRDLPALVSVVIHRRANSEASHLHEIVARRSPLRVVEPVTDESSRLGTVYIAPADRHLMLENGHVRLSRSAQEHRFRPAIDPLFVSASQVHGHRVVGVLLSGGGSDGVLGLTAIKAAGGLCLVQDPAEAPVKTMPLNALQKDQVDAFVTSAELTAALPRLVRGETVALTPRPRPLRSDFCS